MLTFLSLSLFFFVFFLFCFLFFVIDSPCYCTVMPRPSRTEFATELTPATQPG